MALKSLILSKLDHQMSKSWKRIVAHKLQTSSKFEYLIAQLRTGFRQKVFRLKTCPQGVLEAQQEKSKNLIFTTLLWAGPAQNPPLNTNFFKNCFLALQVQSVKWCISHLSDFLDQNTPHGTVLTQKPKLFSSDWSPGMVVLKNVPNQNWTPKSSTKLLGLTHSNALTWDQKHKNSDFTEFSTKVWKTSNWVRFYAH